MKTRAYEGVFVGLLPQRGHALLEVLRDASAQFLGSGRDPNEWTIEYGPLATPAGSVAFRLAHASQKFPWRDSGYMDLARLVSKLAGGRVWAIALEQTPRTGEPEGWAEAVVFDRGERQDHQEITADDARAQILAWFAEQLGLSENEVSAVFESCDQQAGVVSGEEQLDEVDQALARARKEYQRYQDLKAQKKK